MVGDRLPWVSDDEDDPDFDITNEQWKSLEQELGQNIRDAARIDLIEICFRYFYSIRPELNAAKESDVKEIANLIDRKISKFVQFAHGGTRAYSKNNQRTDAEVEFEQRLDKWLGSLLIHPTSEQVVALDNAPAEIKEWLKNNPISIKPSMWLISAIAGNLSAAVQLSGKKRFSKGDDISSSGFKPGRAFNSLILAICGWAEKYELPTSLFKDGDTAHNLPRMLFELHSMFDDKFQKSTIRNQDALAKQMKRAITKSRTNSNSKEI